ncbi:hypothetical protein Efla_003847 [Eimeria flavescens]
MPLPVRCLLSPTASRLLLLLLLAGSVRRFRSSSGSSSNNKNPRFSWGPSFAEAHIHVAPEYFQRCDAFPAPPLTITGGAWLLRELIAPERLCSTSLSAFLICEQHKDPGFAGSPTQGVSLLPLQGTLTAIAGPPPRELQAVDSAERTQPPSLETEQQPDASPSPLPPLPAAVAAAAAAEEEEGLSPPRSSEAASPGGAARARQGHLERRPKGAPHQKSRYSPQAADKPSNQQQKQKQHKQEGKEQKQQQQEEKQHEQQHEKHRHQRGGLLSLSSLASSVFASASVVAATELGDRTFFLAALLAVRYNRYLVFLATCAALFVASAASALAGRLLQEPAVYSWLPGPLRALWGGGVLVLWVSALFLFGFGVWHLRKAWLHYQRAHQGLGAPCSSRLSSRRSKGPSVKVSPELSELSTARGGGGDPFQGPLLASVPGEMGLLSQQQEGAPGEDPARGSTEATTAEGPPHTLPSSAECSDSDEDEVRENMEEAREDVERLQYTRLGLHAEAFRVFREVFLLILLAEWGDKSMFATISLAAAQNPLGVFVGSCLGHAAVTFAGVAGGLLLQRWLTEFSLNLAAGSLMVLVGLGTAFDALS